LIGRLGEYDGRSVEVLERIRDGGAPADDDIDELIGLASGPGEKLAAGATWLLRAWIEAGQITLSPSQWEDLVDGLSGVSDPWARLHIAQTVRSVRVPSGHVATLAGVLSEWRQGDRPFLRAWATDALVVLARDHDEVRDLAVDALRMARADAAPSVRARARRLDAEGGAGE
jgi:hypothetical protein